MKKSMEYLNMMIDDVIFALEDAEHDFNQMKQSIIRSIENDGAIMPDCVESYSKSMREASEQIRRLSKQRKHLEKLREIMQEEV